MVQLIATKQIKLFKKLMAPSSSTSTDFIEAALSCTSTPYVLSYPDPDQRWIIRKHLLSLINNYPTFKPSADTFIHNDGSAVYLLNATGSLRVTGIKYAPTIPVTIWLHENYPLVPPFVSVSPNNSLSSIHPNHPFVNPYSGSTSSAYLQTWTFPRCNLTQLVHNLINIFSHDHPFIFTSLLPSSPSLADPSLFSRMEALDRLSGMIHYDTIALKAKNDEEIDRFSILQEELIERQNFIRNIVTSLEQERRSLKKRAMELAVQADVVTNWLRFNIVQIEGEDGVEDAFEGENEGSRLIIDYLAEDDAIEDLMYALDKALEVGVLSFDSYMRQVRLLAREQFLYRDKIVHITKTS